MSDNLNDQLNDTVADDAENEVRLTRTQKKLYNTVLGKYLITKETKYLAAFILFLITYVLVAGIFISVLSSGAVHKNLFVVLALAASFHTGGNIAARRDKMAAMSGVITFVLWALVSIKP